LLDKSFDKSDNNLKVFLKNPRQDTNDIGVAWAAPGHNGAVDQDECHNRKEKETISIESFPIVTSFRGNHTLLIQICDLSSNHTICLNPLSHKWNLS